MTNPVNSALTSVVIYNDCKYRVTYLGSAPITFLGNLVHGPLTVKKLQARIPGMDTLTCNRVLRILNDGISGTFDIEYSTNKEQRRSKEQGTFCIHNIEQVVAAIDADLGSSNYAIADALQTLAIHSTLPEDLVCTYEMESGVFCAVKSRNITNV